MATNEDAFPQQILEAAKAFPNFSAAYAHLREDVHYIGLHIQAPEIMMLFAGNVQFGVDPQGILFYESLNASVAYFTVFYHEGLGTWKTVRVDFYAVQKHERVEPFARFLTRVDANKYELPPLRPGLGKGRWRRFKAATVQVDVVRQQDSQRLYLQLPPIRKEVFFNTSEVSSINTSGILIFHDLKRLKDKPLEEEGDHRRLLADYSPDKIVFHLKPNVSMEKPKEFGLFLPADPLQGIGANPVQAPETSWRDFEPAPDPDKVPIS